MGKISDIEKKLDPQWIVYAGFLGLGFVMGLLFAEILDVLAS